MSKPLYHIPALLPETMEGLNIKPDGVYVDVTFGGGGHSRAILSRLNEKGRLIAFDQDEDAFRNQIEDDRFTLVQSNFKYLSNFLKYLGVDKVDGILADLGVSFHHFDASDRGFSFRFDAKLDMRMNQKSQLTAAHIINEYPENRLAKIFQLYGEMQNSRRIASVIVKARENGAIETIEELLEVSKKFIPKAKEKKELAKLFQAIRIEVNNEMGTLSEFLSQSVDALHTEGRLAIITYHSLEDRMVKNFLRSGNMEGVIEKDFFGNIISPMKVINNKVITPSDEEIENNPRSRSAKLRIAEKRAQQEG